MNAIEKVSNYTEKFFHIILSDNWKAISFFGIVGLVISYYFNLTMNKDVWFWFFSSIAQTFAGLVAFIVVIFIFLFQSNFQLILRSHYFGEDQSKMNKEFEDNIRNIKNKTWGLLKTTIPLIILSIILIPFGSLKIEDSWIMDIYYTYKLNWILIFSVIGLCSSSLYKISISMRNLLQ